MSSLGGSSRRLLGLALAGALGSTSRPTQAQSPASGPLVQITNASSVLYNVDNRDTRDRSGASTANDHWGFAYNRLNTQATSGPLTLSVRLDGAWFFTSPSPEEVVERLARRAPFEDRTEYDDKIVAAGQELSNR